MNITNVIVSYYVEAVNIMITSTAAPLLYVVGFKPLPFFLAQLIAIFVHCTGSLSVGLGSAISCFQIFYVTKFELVFSWDPEKVGKRTFFILAAIISLPHAIAGIYSIFNYQYVDKRVALFTKSDDQHEVTGFPNNYSMFWLLMFIIISFLLLFSSHYFTKIVNLTISISYHCKVKCPFEDTYFCLWGSEFFWRLLFILTSQIPPIVYNFLVTFFYFQIFYY